MNTAIKRAQTLAGDALEQAVQSGVARAMASRQAAGRADRRRYRSSLRRRSRFRTLCARADDRSTWASSPVRSSIRRSIRRPIRVWRGCKLPEHCRPPGWWFKWLRRARHCVRALRRTGKAARSSAWSVGTADAPAGCVSQRAAAGHRGPSRSGAARHIQPRFSDFQRRARAPAAGIFPQKQSKCKLADKIVRWAPVVVDKLPACTIRPDCRWWKEQGRAACMRCPQVVTDRLEAPEALAQAADPTVS